MSLIAEMIRTLFLTLFYFRLIAPLPAQGQLLGKYSIRVIVENAYHLNPPKIRLIDSAGKVVLIKNCNSSGWCDFTGIKKGTYRIVEEEFHIDTTVVLPSKEMNRLRQTELWLNFDISAYALGAAQARKEIQQGRVSLFLIGGLAPIYIRGEEKIERRYNFRYYDFGDSGSPALNRLIEYDNTVFAHLDSIYGNTWRQEVRHDVIGFEKYIATHPVRY